MSERTLSEKPPVTSNLVIPILIKPIVQKVSGLTLYIIYKNINLFYFEI